MTIFEHKDISVGNIFLDEQHRHFLKLIDSLVIANNKILEDVVGELESFVQYHFETEEQLLEEVDFPLIAQHKEQHMTFLKKVGTMIGKVHNKTLTIDEVRTVLMNWYLHHICVEDMKYKKYLP